MFGFAPLGVGPFESPLPPWRKIVESTQKVTAAGNAKGIGNPKAGGGGKATGGFSIKTRAVAVSSTAGALVRAQGTIKSKAAHLREARSTLTAQGNPKPRGAFLLEARAVSKPRARMTPIAVAFGQAHSRVAGVDVIHSSMIAISASAPVIRAQASVVGSSSATELPPTLATDAPALQPLDASHAADDLEAELKALFMQLFETYVRPDERYTNVLGMPQHGPRALIESSLANDGLSIYRGADNASGAGAYLLRAWRAQNPKRGLHLLETYLQLLWPNVWSAKQMWQDANGVYTENLATEESEGRFLTSRVHVTLPGSVTSGGDVQAISSGLRASLPARIVMNLAIVGDADFKIGIAARFYAGAVTASYEGNFK